MFVLLFCNIFGVIKRFSFGVLGKCGVLTKYFYFDPLSQSHPFSYFSIPDIYIKNNINHLSMCMPIYLKMVPGKYLGKLDIPIYSKVINKLNSGIYYK